MSIISDLVVCIFHLTLVQCPHSLPFTSPPSPLPFPPLPPSPLLSSPLFPFSPFPPFSPLPLLSPPHHIRSSLPLNRFSCRLLPHSVEVLVEAVQEEGHELLGILLGQRLELVELVVHQMLHGRWRERKGRGGKGGRRGREEMGKGGGSGTEGRGGEGKGEQKGKGTG